MENISSLKEASSELSKSSDSNDDDMSFNTAYDTLYKEYLSLKKEQLKWNGSQKSLIKEVEVLKGEKKSLLYKITFLQHEHSEIKKKGDQLKNENHMFKNELSHRKEESHPNSQRLNDLINSKYKSSDTRDLGFVSGNVNRKTFFVNPYGKEPPKKTHARIKFHYTKMRHTLDRCYTRLSDNFYKKLNQPNE